VYTFFFVFLYVANIEQVYVLSVSLIAYSSGLSFAVVQAGQMNGKEPHTSAPKYGWYNQHDWTAGASRRWRSEVSLAPLTEITNFKKKKSLLFIEFPVICLSHFKIVERRLIFLFCVLILLPSGLCRRGRRRHSPPPHPL
jgi:hypothetical protein